MPENVPTLQSATEFVLSHATDTDLDRLFQSIKQRRKALAVIRTTSLAVGETVTIAGINPKYLVGLTGVIMEINRTRGTALATVALDARSTEALRYEPKSRRVIPDAVTSYPLDGIPLVCCRPVD
jgi:hypothetical protein